MTRVLLSDLIVLFGFTLTASPAFAHLDSVAPEPLLVGIGHAFLGLDHFLTLLAVGLWAGRRGGVGLWAFPLSLTAGLALGLLLATWGLVPEVERIVRSVVVVATVLVGILALLRHQVAWLPAAGALVLLGVGHSYLSALEVGAADLALAGAGLLMAAMALLSFGVVTGLAGSQVR